MSMFFTPSISPDETERPPLLSFMIGYWVHYCFVLAALFIKPYTHKSTFTDGDFVLPLK